MFDVMVVLGLGLVRYGRVSLGSLLGSIFGVGIGVLGLCSELGLMMG